MSEITDGGPAFPRAGAVFKGPNGQEMGNEASLGMTVRDYFAAKAMQSLIEKVVLRDQATMPRPIVTEAQEKIARDAYAYADAMIKAKESK
jgi:hypothetical protein